MKAETRDGGEVAQMNDSVVRPAYAEPPWDYVNSSQLNVVVRLQEPERIGRFLPSGLAPAPASDVVVFMFLDAPQVPQLGDSYHSTECGLIVPAVTPGGVRGSQYSFMLVDNDPAISAGREVWGFPKKLGQVRMRRLSDTDVTARATHLPFREWNRSGVLQVEAHLDGSNEGLWEETSALHPRILSRQVRSPEGRAEGWTHTLQGGGVTKVHERMSGSATLVLGDSEEEGLRHLGPHEVLGALFVRCDFVLDYGTPVA